MNSFRVEVWGWNRTCGKIPISLWKRFASCLASLSEIKFQPILFVDSSEIRLWNSPGLCQMNHSYSPVIFTKSSKMLLLCCSKNQNEFLSQIRFDKWSWMVKKCSFLTTSWNFMLMYVRRLNNYQNSLLSTFFGTFDFPRFSIFGISRRLHRTCRPPAVMRSRLCDGYHY